jgi:outer membrane protein assembly factor BamD (BamD/ComL family)
MKIRRTVIIIFVAILISGFCYSQQEQPMGELLKEGLSLFKAGEYSGAIEKFDLVIKTENSKEIIPAKLLKGKVLKNRANGRKQKQSYQIY